MEAERLHGMGPAWELGGLTAGPAELQPGTAQLRAEVLRRQTPFLARRVLLAESLRASEGTPWWILRRARATAHLLNRCPIAIRKGERLVGAHPATPAVDSQAVAQAEAYLARQSFHVRAASGQVALDLVTILHHGLDGLLAQLRRLRAELRLLDPHRAERRTFYEAAEIALEGFQRFVLRYALLARQQAAAEAARRDELLATAAVCEAIAHRPPRNCREALQLAWFCLLGAALEAGEGHQSLSPGRLDQWLLPFYLAECEAGTFDPTDLDDLLDQFLLKLADFPAGEPGGVIVSLAGRRLDGGDATNDLSYRLLHAACRVRLPQPGLAVLWHRDLPEPFLRDACRLLTNGAGHPTFVNTDLVADGLLRHGLPYEHAIDHVATGCGAASVQGRSCAWAGWPQVNLAMALLAALGGGCSPTGEMIGLDTPLPRTWDGLLDALDVQIRHAAQVAVAQGMEDQALASRRSPLPLQSCFIEDCLGRGVHANGGGARYTFLQPAAIGLVNVVESLAAVRLLVCEQGRFSLADVRAALANNWRDHDELRAAVASEAPRFGSDHESLARLFAIVAGTWCSHVESCHNYFGGGVLPGLLAAEGWQRLGAETPATPDGRCDGAPLTPCFAAAGREAHDLETILFTAAGLDQSRALGGMAFDLRLWREDLLQPGGLDRLQEQVVYGLTELETLQLGFEVVSTADLMGTEERPADGANPGLRLSGCVVRGDGLDQAARELLRARPVIRL